MEILKRKNDCGRIKAFAVATLILLLVTAVCLNASEKGLASFFYPFNKWDCQVAYADNSAIGESGGAIEIADVTEGKASSTFSSSELGVKLKITLPLAATDIYFAYEIDSSENVWAISGDSKVDKDIPYILHEGKVEKNVVDTKTLGKIESSWTDISVIYEKKVFYVDVHLNGTFYVTCNMSGETKMLSDSKIIKDIDTLAPTMQKGYVTHGIKNKDGKYIFEINATFTDGASTSGLISSARSGIKAITIIRSDVEIENLNSDNITSENFENILSWELLNKYQALLTQKVTFNLEKDGFYYYFAVDRVGNLSVNLLFGGKFSRDEHSDTDDRFYVFDKYAGTTGATFSVKDKMTTIGQELDDYNGKVSSIVYEKAVEAYSALLLRFYSGASETDLEAVSAEWFSFFNNEYTAFRNAVALGATFDTEVINGDLLFAPINALNLNKDNITSLGGDEIKASFIVARYEGTELSDEVKRVAALGSNVKGYKLSYTLTVNGVRASVPKSPVIFELIGIPDNIEDYSVVCVTADGVFDATAAKGENWLRFSTSLNSCDFYIVYTEKNAGSNLLPLWIALGSVLGVIVILGVIYLILWKLGKLPKTLMPKRTKKQNKTK